MNESTALAPIDPLTTLLAATVADLPSEHSRRVYSLWLREFIASRHPLNREGVLAFLTDIRDRRLSAASVNQARSAIRKLVVEAEHRELLSERDTRAIRAIKGDPVRGQRVGNWLTLEGVRSLLKMPDRETERGKRNAALLAIMIGTGLRRSEVSRLPWSCYQVREERHCLVDLKGKGNKIRTVPIPDWCRADIDAWRPYSIGPLMFDGLTSGGIHWIITEYGERMGVPIRPHDLRRTLARLMKRAGVEIEQISVTLGHQKIETTRRYLGGILELGRLRAGVDQIQWEAEAKE